MIPFLLESPGFTPDPVSRNALGPNSWISAFAVPILGIDRYSANIVIPFMTAYAIYHLL